MHARTVARMRRGVARPLVAPFNHGKPTALSPSMQHFGGPGDFAIGLLRVAANP